MDVWEFALGLLSLAVCLLVSIALHELGHLIPAKKFGVHVSQYMVGFGPTIFSKKIHDTEYGVKVLPIGGYIRMRGMYAGIEDPDLERTGGLFYELRTWQRVTIMFAGPFVNLILAFTLLTVGFWGFGSTAVGVNSVSQCIPTAITSACTPESTTAPAYGHLQEGDVLLSIDNEVITSWSQVSSYVQSHPGDTISMTLLRDGTQVKEKIKLGTTETAEGERIGFLGMSALNTLQPQSFGSALDDVSETTLLTVNSILRIPVSVVDTAIGLVSPEEGPAERPVSIIGAGHIAGAISSAPTLTTEAKVQSIVLIAGQINFALFLLNLIPLPPFDGGHIAVALWQKVKNTLALRRGMSEPSPINVNRLAPAALTVLIIFGAASLVFMLADVINPVL